MLVQVVVGSRPRSHNFEQLTIEDEPVSGGSLSHGHHLKMSDANRIEITDILIGEVWLCFGQSNMAWTVAKSADSKAAIASANFPSIRQVEIPQRISNVPIEVVQTDWKVCSPSTVGNFTACGYFMARKLHQELQVPIGLVTCAWGGTRIEPWIPMDGFANVPSLQSIHQSVVDQAPGTDANRRLLAAHIEATKRWTMEAEAAFASGKAIGPNPTYPPWLFPFDDRQDPTMLFNGMVRSVVGYGSMQVNNVPDKQTVFAINHWKLGPRADVGIGNSTGRALDWTFSANASTYPTKRLRVYVRPFND